MIDDVVKQIAIFAETHAMTDAVRPANMKSLCN
jgi:hypothetical protein